MKLNKIIIATAIASLITPNIYADNNSSTVVEGVAVVETVGTPKPVPVVGSSVVDVTVTEVYATGYRASKVIHANVYNKKGELIGKINDFIIGSEQSVTFAIIGVGGFLGLGEKLVAVPSILLETNAKNQLVLPNAEKKDLKALPEFKFHK